MLLYSNYLACVERSVLQSFMYPLVLSHFSSCLSKGWEHRRQLPTPNLSGLWGCDTKPGPHLLTLFSEAEVYTQVTDKLLE